MATPISLYCEPDRNNQANKGHVFISFDIKSKQVFNLLGYDSKSTYGKSVGYFDVEPAFIQIGLSSTIHRINRIDLTYSYYDKNDFNYGTNDYKPEKFYCEKDIKPQI